MSPSTLAARAFLALLLLAPFPRGAAAQDASYLQSVEELMAAQKLADRMAGPRLAPPRFAADRRHLRVHPNPNSRKASSETRSARNPATFSPTSSSPSDAADAPAAPQTPGINVLGATLAETNAFPPDISGGAGPSQFLLGVNGRIRTFHKTTGVADGVLNAEMDVFFNSVRAGDPTASPRVRFDRLSSRWIVTVNSFSVSITDNRILIAVSDAASAGVISNATVWTYFSFRHDLAPPAGDSDLFFDSPSLGVDVNGLTIGGNLFNEDGDYQGTSVHAVRKSRLLAGPGGDLVPAGDVAAFRNLTTTPTGEGPYAPQGVDDQHDAAASKSWIAGVDNATFGTLVFRSIDFGTSGAWPPVAISSNLTLEVPETDFPRTVPHQGNNFGADGELDAVDDRLSSSSLRNGSIWTAHAIEVDDSGESPGDRDGSRWYEVDVSSGTPSLLQVGTLFDTAATNPRSYWIPSIAVSGQGHAALGSSAAGATQRINAATAGRLAGDAPGTLQSALLFTASSTSYNPPGDPGPARRWGDYSVTSVDPSDDMTLWTVQQYCDATDSYGLRILELVAPGPAAFASAAPNTVPSGQTSVSVVVTGTPTSGRGFFDPGAGYPNRIQAAVSGGVTVNSVTYTNPASITLDLNTVSVPPAAVTVTITNPDGQFVTSGSGFLTVGTAGPAPTVTAIANPSGPAAGGTAATLTGTNFLAGAAVSFGSVPATGVDVTSASNASLTTPVLAPGTLNDVTLTNADTQSGTLEDGFFADFLDVAQADIFHAAIETIFRNGVTAGCGGGNYCRNDPVTRAQMAVFLLKSKEGASYAPPACTGTVFGDVPCTGGIYDAWIEELADRGITAGCGGGNYCPGDAVTRAQMAPFLLKTEFGSAYGPPNCTGIVFDDVLCTGTFDAWIEDLDDRGITAGCSAVPPLYCPDAANTRGEMAVFLVSTFELP